MMKKLAPIALLLLSCCVAPPPPQESLKNLYEIEYLARQIKPQSDVALLYLISSENTQTQHETGLIINNELSMQQSKINEKFYVFCLPPGKYDITYRGGFLIPNKQEFLNAEAGAIYVRDFSQFALMILPILPPVTASRVKDTEINAAKQQIGYKRIGSELEYANSRYRCRSLS